MRYTTSKRTADKARDAGLHVQPCEGYDDDGNDCPAWAIHDCVFDPAPYGATLGDRLAGVATELGRGAAAIRQLEADGILRIVEPAADDKPDHDWNGAFCSACGVDEASGFAAGPCEPDEALT